MYARQSDFCGTRRVSTYTWVRYGCINIDTSARGGPLTRNIPAICSRSITLAPFQLKHPVPTSQTEKSTLTLSFDSKMHHLLKFFIADNIPSGCINHWGECLQIEVVLCNDSI